MKLLNIVPAATIFLMVLLSSTSFSGTAVRAQEPLFELPVQLVGFPVIILSVRLANFAKKLAYSLNPKTYQSRNRREIAPTMIPTGDEISRLAIDVAQAERKILQEFGPKVCIEEEPCRMNAIRMSRVDSNQPDWDDILKNYKVRATGMKQWYLLSVFIGDYIQDVQFCKQLAKRLACDRNQKEFVRD
ncbi:uncharacterized protein LOC129769604 [Toxorhynchites rutilus septentrionalis]|uniref:uncharacterized protein LOC129769604 n=1 Tax=Toxorhynchites rutilus septentrionalis TaxID=329112 RepID=UPI00247A36C1|nr:uncharacterized protein LOC129769604 [Toxorhynchites rutilus septentrionalis]